MMLKRTRMDDMELNHAQLSLEDGTRLHYVTAGQGEPVLLWHGFLGTWFTWRKVISLLAPRYQLLIPDMRGYGDSDKPVSGYDGQRLCEDFRALVRHLDLGPLHVVAHDMGAPPALLWAALYPAEVRSLTYLDEPILTSQSLTPMFSFGPQLAKSGGLWWWLLALAGDAPERLVVGREEAFLRWFSENYLVQRNAIDDTAHREYLRTFLGREGVLGAFGVYREIFSTMHQTEALLTAPMTTPVLALGGAASIGDGAMQMMKSVAEHVRGGKIEDCGHFIPEEQPAELVRQMLAFWQASN